MIAFELLKPIILPTNKCKWVFGNVLKVIKQKIKCAQIIIILKLLTSFGKNNDFEVVMNCLNVK